MNIILTLAILLLGFALPTHAYQFIFDGEADNQYPIVIEVDRYPHGAIYGRYAYTKTLKRMGRDNDNAWLYITPVSNSTSDYTITDNQGNIQERWSNATFWRENNVNFLSVSVRNAKGKAFNIDAHTASKNTTTWAGSYDVHSDGYRNCPPPISVRLTLNENGKGGYKGIWSMRLLEDDDNESGSLFGDVIGTINGNTITLTLTRYSCSGGTYGCYFNQGNSCSPHIEKGSVIAKITKSGSSFKIEPIGTMKGYLNDLGGILTIVKTK